MVRDRANIHSRLPVRGGLMKTIISVGALVSSASYAQNTAHTPGAEPIAASAPLSHAPQAAIAPAVPGNMHRPALPAARSGRAVPLSAARAASATQ